MAKTYSQTYLYGKFPDYDKNLFKFIMEADRIDTKSEQFADIVYDIKRRKISDSLTKILQSNKVVLGITKTKSLPKAFKVFVAKDVKENKDELKVFIDVTECVREVNGQYICNHVEWIISYLINTMTSFTYTLAENRLVGNASIIKDGGEAFMRCFSYIFDRLYKISTVKSLRSRVEYAAVLYYQINILRRNYQKNYDSIVANAIKISNIEKRDAQVVDVMFEQKDFATIDTFITALARVFNFNDLKISMIIDMWMKAFGTGTVFALEYFPAFACMLTDAYVGGYINQQLTIEKITGTSMVVFSKTILQVGGSVV